VWEPPHFSPTHHGAKVLDAALDSNRTPHVDCSFPLTLPIRAADHDSAETIGVNESRLLIVGIAQVEERTGVAVLR
jgi:hypothetical protein